jgi:hypothetical protein
VARTRGGRCGNIEARRIWARDAVGILGVPWYSVRYWIKTYLPHNGERMWGRPLLTFQDLFWLAYIASSRAAGTSTHRAARGIARVRRLLKTWDAPLSQTALCEAGDALVLARGRFSIEAPPPAVIVDGPELARAVLTRHKKRTRVHRGGKEKAPPIGRGVTP